MKVTAEIPNGLVDGFDLFEEGLQRRGCRWWDDNGFLKGGHGYL